LCAVREAKEKSREGWYMAYIMDTNEEERSKVGWVGCASGALRK
jgi:translation elongation factor EF-1alpha